MPFSHHSHSGEFCGHATGKLEEMVQTAISKKMLVYALTEHMPRDLEDFYPEEIEDHPDAESLVRLMDNFYYEATRLKAKYGENIDLLVGFESEWIRSSSLKLIQDLLRKYDWDMFVGSVHHVNTVPIDFSRELYEDARKRSGGSDESLFEDYFDAQYEMMKATSPPIVGHFDVIRLLSDNPNASLKQWEGVWNRIERNLQLVSEYGGVLELNSSALRKGLYEPYPQVEICQAFLKFGGRFTISDDAHSTDQVGTNYVKLLPAIKAAGIEDIYFYSPRGQQEKARVTLLSTSVSELLGHPLWCV